MDQDIDDVAIPSKEEIGYKAEEEDEDGCQKCGGEMQSRAVEDESYRVCMSCGFTDAS